MPANRSRKRTGEATLLLVTNQVAVDVPTSFFEVHFEKQRQKQFWPSVKAQLPFIGISCLSRNCNLNIVTTYVSTIENFSAGTSFCFRRAGVVPSELESSLKAVKTCRGTSAAGQSLALTPSLASSSVLCFFFYPHPGKLVQLVPSLPPPPSPRVPPPPHGRCDACKPFPASGLPAVSELSKQPPFSVFELFIYLFSIGSDRNNKCQGHDWARSISQSKFQPKLSRYSLSRNRTGLVLLPFLEFTFLRGS